MGRLPAVRAERTPDRPGPGETPEALLRALDITVRRRVEGLVAGEFRSSTLGPGSELSQVRPYQPGDDVRQIDWNVTARTREPHVRVQVAERALITGLALDAAAARTFGTADRRKIDVAEGVALAVGHLATRHGNRLGVLTFGEPEPRLLPPRQGRVGLIGLLEALRREPQSEGGGATSLGTALTKLSGVARQPALIVVVSDFRGPRDWRPGALRLAGRHDVIAVEIRDRREQELPDVGQVWMLDPETGRQMRVDTSSKDLRERFAAAAADDRRAVADELASVGVDHVVLATHGDWLRELAGFLRLRSRTQRAAAPLSGRAVAA
jgi:uncharacterized protein (DUF58 family)